MVAALFEWFLWALAFTYCLGKVFIKAEHYTIRILAVVVGAVFLALRVVFVPVMLVTLPLPRAVERLWSPALVEALASGRLGAAGLDVFAKEPHVPEALLQYLKPGGRMVLPLAQRDAQGEATQRLTVIESTAAGYREKMLDAVRFVSLLSGLV